MTTRYKVFFKDTLLGILEVDENNKHKFTTNEEGVNAAKEETVLIVEIVNGTDGFVDPIPFFENRLKNAERLGLDEIRYHTDYFVIKKEI